MGESKKEETWSMIRTPKEVTLEYRALPPNFVLLAAMGVLGLLVFFFMLLGGFFDVLNELKNQIFFSKERGPEGWLSIIPLIFFLPFVLWPMVGIYAVGAGLLNHYRVTADEKGLRSFYGPFPWPGAVSIPKDQVLQVFCAPDNGSPALKAMTTTGRTKVLLPAAPSMEQIWEAEEAIESFMGIRDQEVRGESANPKAYKSGDTALWIPPKGMRLNQSPGLLELIFPSEKVLGYFLLPFSLLWTGIIASVFGIINLNQTEGKIPLGINLMVSLFLIIGLVIMYVALSSLINKHTLTITPTGINYKIGPLPVPGAQSLSATGFAGARLETTTRRSSKGGTYTVHQVYVDYQDGRQINLCGTSLGKEAGDLVVLAAMEILSRGQ